MLQNEIYLHGEKVLIQSIKERESVHLMVSQIFNNSPFLKSGKVVIDGIDLELSR